MTSHDVSKQALDSVAADASWGCSNLVSSATVPSVLSGPQVKGRSPGLPVPLSAPHCTCQMQTPCGVYLFFLFFAFGHMTVKKKFNSLFLGLIILFARLTELRKTQTAIYHTGYYNRG